MRKGRQRTPTPHHCIHRPDPNDPDQVLPDGTLDEDFGFEHPCRCLTHRKDHEADHE